MVQKFYTSNVLEFTFPAGITGREAGLLRHMGTHERCWRWFVALAMLGLGAVVAWMIPTPEGPPPWVPIADLAARHGEAPEFIDRFRQGFRDHIFAALHPKGYAGWPIWAASGRKPL